MNMYNDLQSCARKRKELSKLEKREVGIHGSNRLDASMLV